MQRLTQYTGLYWKKDDEHAARVLLNEGKLFVEFSEDDPLELTALSDNRFQMAVDPVTFTFEEAAAGASKRMSIQAPGEEKPDVFERIIEFQPAPNQLAGYAGSYVSDEIDPVYRIEAANGSLVLKRLKSKPQKLMPTLEDYFQGEDGDLHFQRNPAGKVTAFDLNSGGIKNFHFRKAAQ